MTRFVLLLVVAALLGACGESPRAASAPAPDTPTAAEARDVTGPLPWPADLAVPELRTVGDIPADALVVVIREDGAFEWSGDVGREGRSLL